MSTNYERTIEYDSGKDSVYNENAESLSEALDRELKFVEGQAANRNLSKGRKLVSITIREKD